MRNLALAASLLATSTTFAAVTERPVDISDFDVINLKGNMDVRVVQAEQFSVVVATEDEWQQWVMVEREGDTLSVRLDPSRPTGFFSKEYEVDVMISLPIIEEIYIQGSGEVFAETIDADDLELRVDGSGDIVMSAVVAKNLDLAINGSGDLKLALVGAENLRVKVAGSGDVKIADLSAVNLESAIRGSGDIKIGGSAGTTVIEVYGSGDFDGRYLAVGETDVTIFGSGDVWLDANTVSRQSIRGSGDIHLTRH